MLMRLVESKDSLGFVNKVVSMTKIEFGEYLGCVKHS